MSKKFWVCCQNAHPESFWTSSNDRVPRIRTLRDRTSRGMTVYHISNTKMVRSAKKKDNGKWLNHLQGLWNGFYFGKAPKKF